MTEFEKELVSLLNRHSKENESNTPDFILARYLNGCLRLFNATVNARSDWYGRHDQPGQFSVSGVVVSGGAREGIPHQLERDDQRPSSSE